MQGLPNDQAVYTQFNDTGQQEIERFTKSFSGTVTYSVSGSGTFDASVIVAGASLSLGVTLSKSSTTSVTLTAYVKTPNGDFADALFGVWEYKSVGEYYYETNTCITENEQTITAWVPYGAGSDATWISSYPGGPAIGGIQGAPKF